MPIARNCYFAYTGCGPEKPEEVLKKLEGRHEDWLIIPEASLAGAILYLHAGVHFLALEGYYCGEDRFGREIIFHKAELAHVYLAAFRDPAEARTA